MASRLTTYQQIADILSFEVNANALQHKLTETKVDWDAIVVEGSRHLVLPALYCRLKAKNSLQLLPKELQTYLEELTTINRNRNQSILEQVRDISDLFTEHNIDHVFLKGAAMLASGYYKDIAERMVGDIDILVAEDQLKQAYDLMIVEGYKATATLKFGAKYFEHKHLPRLASKIQISAVELHRKLFVSYQTDLLKNNDILTKKSALKTVTIPYLSHLEYHNVLNFQINDSGYDYNTFNFRTAYDSLVLMHNGTIDTNNANKPLKQYYRKLEVFFENLSLTKSNSKSLNTQLFLWKLRDPFLGRLSNKLVYSLLLAKILINRLYLFIFNRHYRSDVLNDRHRVVRLLKSKF